MRQDTLGIWGSFSPDPIGSAGSVPGHGFLGRLRGRQETCPGLPLRGSSGASAGPSVRASRPFQNRSILGTFWNSHEHLRLAGVILDTSFTMSDDCPQFSECNSSIR